MYIHLQEWKSPEYLFWNTPSTGSVFNTQLKNETTGILALQKRCRMKTLKDYAKCPEYLFIVNKC